MKTILITGATDGIGLETAKMLAKYGHNLLIHGRDAQKLDIIKQSLLKINNLIIIETFKADLSILAEAKKLGQDILTKVSSIDIIINNAGVFIVDNAHVVSFDNLDVRFAVNTIAPYILTKHLMPSLSSESRVINLASAAQAPINFDALIKYMPLSPDQAYAQSKLGLIMWSMEMAKNHPQGPIVIAVNPKSFLGSKMVKQVYGRDGYNLKIGAEILCQAALTEEFATANGRYFDNDYERFATPHPFALNKQNRLKLMEVLDSFYT